jgi:signal transduction histidine kinase
MLESMGSKIRWILICSLGGFLLLITIAGAAAWIMLDRVQSGEATLRTRMATRSSLLEQIRGGVYLSGTIARDYAVAPESPEAPALRARLTQLEADTRRAVERYASEAPRGGHDFVQLRAEISAYWKLLDFMVEIAGRHPSPGLDAYFRRQLADRREAMLHISAEIGVTLYRESQQAQFDLAVMYARFRWLFVVATTLPIVVGLALAWATVHRLVHLEAETRALSAQLVRAQEEERRSIARELHDDVAQSLSRLMLDVGRAASTSDSAVPRSELASFAASIEHAVDSVRRIALSLRPSMLDDLGLVAALEWQAREIGNRTGLHIEVNAEDSAGELPEALRTCIYRIAQEALRNCVRHASAKSVTVGLTKNGSSVSLRIADDGAGFRSHRMRGLGLLGMEERVAQLRGRFRVHSEPGHGTTVEAELPL